MILTEWQFEGVYGGDTESKVRCIMAADPKHVAIRKI